MLLSRRQTLALLASAVVAPRRAGGQVGPPAPAAKTKPALPVATTAPIAAAPSVVAVRGPCDALLAAAIRSPYGWGWAEGEPGIDLTKVRPRGGPPVVDAELTAVAGLVLHLAGEAADEPKYLAAAVEAARAVLAVQARSGQVRARGVMGAFGGKEDPAELPDRRPARRGLALLLTVLDAQADQPDPRLKGPAQRVAHWLAGQQTHIGGWPTLYPPGASKGRGVRLVRLDDPDARDSTLALLLAGEVLADRGLRPYVDRAADHLVTIRLTAGRPPTKALWPAACKLDGDSNTGQLDLPPAVDLLGTRYAAEALLAGLLVTFEAGRYDAPLREARDALSGLPRTAGGGWHRRYDLQLRPSVPRPDTRPAEGVFTPPPPPPAALPNPRPAELLARLARASEVGGKRLAEEMSARVPLRRRLALAASGLAPDALLLDDPAAGRLPTLVADGEPLGPSAAIVAEVWRALESPTVR
ncbi:MAG: hypothetical protein JWO31_3886 [Phycisphaerales bacterium]|nr:hypothetical protein [Phycisphaerales bacterium]